MGKRRREGCMGGRDEPLTRPKVLSHAGDRPRRLKTSKVSERSEGDVATKPPKLLGVSAVYMCVLPCDDLLLCAPAAHTLCAQGGWWRVGEGNVQLYV